jgi:hypothetical protein
MSKGSNRQHRLRVIGWLGVGLVYILTLATQLPHIYDVYSALERGDYSVAGFSTAAGAALAFEASVAIFTLRLIVNTKSERGRWTRFGIAAFLAISAFANVSYYFDLAPLDNVIMPAILAVALPGALWLYADEFGKGARAEAKRKASTASEPAANPKLFPAACDFPGCDWSDEYSSPVGATNALNGHSKKHRVYSDNGVEREAVEERG